MKKVAIVGCGGMGGGHAVAISSGTGNAVWKAGSKQEADRINVITDHSLDTDISKKLALAGIYDINPERIRWAEERGYYVYGSFEEVLADDSVDIVLIATPNHLHREQAIRAMRAGKHVLCEKPVMINSEDMKAVIQTARETGKIFYPRQNRRWDPDYLIIKKIYEEKLIGNTFRIESRVHGSRGIPGDWRGKKECGGGMLLDWGVHILDRMLVLIPEKIKSVYCQLSHVMSDEVDDGFTAYLNFDNGVSVVIEVGTCNFISLPLWYIAGDHGSAVIHNWNCEGHMVQLSSWDDKDAKPILAGAGLTKTMAPRTDSSLKTLPLPKPEFDHNELYSNLADAIDGTAEQIVTMEHALRVIELMETLLKSAEKNEVIYLD